MKTTYTIVEVDRDLAYDVEQLGTKRKFWFRRFEDESVRWLFQNFAKKAIYSFYCSEDSKRPLGTLDAFREFAKSSPKNAEIWLDRLKLLALADFEVIISKVPASRMSSLTREFTIQLLEANQTNLLGG